MDQILFEKKNTTKENGQPSGIVDLLETLEKEICILQQKASASIYKPY
jgi:hypothetical protein